MGGVIRLNLVVGGVIRLNYSLVMGGVIRLNLVVGGVIRLNNNSIYLKPDDLVLLLAECTASATPPPCLLRGL